MSQGGAIYIDGRNEGFKNPSSALVFKIVVWASMVISIMGMIFVMLSFMEIIQIKPGTLCCGSEYTLHTMVYMFVLTILGTMPLAFSLCYHFVNDEIM